MTCPLETMLINIRPLLEMSSLCKNTSTSRKCSDLCNAKLIVCEAHVINDDYVCHIAMMAYSENITLQKVTSTYSLNRVMKYNSTTITSQRMTHYVLRL